MLPQHYLYDCTIDLLKMTQPPFGPIYNLFQNEPVAFLKCLNENFAKNFIRHSKSPAGTFILFVKKKDGSVLMCVDYHGINKITIKIDIHCRLFFNFLISLVKPTFIQKAISDEFIIWLG
jgi:hypothetical protein